MAIMLFDRWLHIVSGVMWVGLLYYFNFVQMPALAAASADKEGPGPAAITRYVAPRALFWFRYASLATWLSGALYLVFKPGQAVGKYFVQAFTLGIGQHDPLVTSIGIGAWLGTIMLANVWLVIWPAQQRILGMVPATDAEKASARRRALMASRANVALSLPMLLFMQSGSHGVPF